MNSRMAGQTLNDRILAAKHSIAGQGLAKSVCKATTEEMIGPKKKHLDYLIHCTNEPNVSIPQLANLLIERSQNTNWIVVYKALITVHNLMCYGNERFTQYLASSNSSFQLSHFLDKSGVQGAISVRTGYDMSPFIRKYARYLNEKALSYRTVAFDFCKIKRGKEDGMLRTMNAEKLLKTIPTLQNQLDALLEFDCSANDLTNGVINMCFMLLFRDLIRLFACYNDGIINLLEKYFDMNKKQCKEALDIYKKFLVRMDKVGEFLKVAENVGIDKGDIPDLTKAPSSLLEALEQHLQYVEGKNKSSTASTPQSTTSSNQKNVRSGVSALSSTSSSFGTVVANGRLVSQNGIDENLKLKALQEEEEAINQFNKSKNVSTNNSTVNNPFLSSAPTTTSSSSQSTPISDLFTAEPIPAAAQPRASDDLLQLGNPFVDAFTSPAPAQQMYQQPVNPWLSNGFSNVPQQQPTSVNGPFVSENNFNSVFGNTDTSSTADGNVNAQPYNPFLIDDTEPPMLLDTDSPTSSHTKPIQDVLKFFQKDENFVETERNINNVGEEKVNDKIQFNKNFSNVSKDSVKNTCDNTTFPRDESYLLHSDEFDTHSKKKTVPPPRPPPPKVVEIKSETEEESSISSVTLNPKHESISNETDPETLPVNNITPSVFTANEELSVFSHNTGYDSLGGILQPTSLQSNSSQASTQQPISNNQPQHQQQQQQQQQQQSSALITGDLESSLASLAENLSINNRPPVKSVQWNSPKNGSKIGNSWTPQPMAATTGAGYKPMNQSLTVNQPVQPATNMQPQLYPTIQPMMGMRPMVPTSGILPARPAGMTTPTGNPMNQQSLLFH